MPKPKTSGPTFQSYIGSNGILGRGRSGSLDELRLPDEPPMLPGETLITKAETVSKFIPYNELKQGITGTLFITNFKISFQSADCSTHDLSQTLQRNKLYGEDDIVLNTVDAVYQVSKGRRKKLLPGNISGYVKKLEIQTKDFRIHSFSFKLSPRSEAKMMVNAIVHHAFPTRLELLFAFEYKGADEQQSPNDGSQGLPSRVPRFTEERDWQVELDRLGVQGYKPVPCNDGYRMSDNLPEFFVVPNAMSIQDITSSTPQFMDYRCPFWSYTYKGQSSLVRMAFIRPGMQERVADTLTGKITMAHRGTPPWTFDLTRHLPGVKDIQNSYEKLRDLCMPGSLKEVHSSDRSWFSGLHDTQWLQHVSLCLAAASEIARRMSNKKPISVIVKEPESRDLTPLTTCLVQLLLDPHCRTFAGFQALVEKEWVAMGHKFSDRIGMVPTSDTEQSPVFLLFLDCVWQLQKQFPSAFQFSEVYLTTLWDTVCLGLFENFLFNSTRERVLASRKVKSYTGREGIPKFLSAWDWSHQFSSEDLSLFKNPLYLTRTELNLEVNSKAGKAPINATVNRKTLNRIYAKRLTGIYESERQQMSQILQPEVSAPMMKFWEHCYLRWLTPIQIVAGGTPSEYLQQCILVEEIMCFQHKIRSLETATPFVRSERPKSELIFSFDAREMPSKKWTNNLTSSFPFTPLGTLRHSSFYSTPLSVYMETSMLHESDADSIDELDQSEFEASLNEDEAFIAQGPTLICPGVN